MPQALQRLLEQYVREVQNLYGTHLKQVILYGSYARGDFRADSDVDIMILLHLPDLKSKAYSQRLSCLTYDFNMEHGVEIKPIVKSAAHFEKWAANYPFYSNIQREGVILYGAA